MKRNPVRKKSSPKKHVHKKNSNQNKGHKNDLTVIQIKSSGHKKKDTLNQENSDDRTIIINPQKPSENKSERDNARKNADTDKTRIQLNSQSKADKTIITKKINVADKTQLVEKSTTYKSQDARRLQVGSIINERFVLEEVLGIGGMGKVYKALDLRKKEALDKNPFVAIKVLNDEFREHPESLIALQREARKSQQLSHPNIVNVHDFDRDGTTVYMTMELLNGKSLDEVIAHDFPDGMPEVQAINIINSLSNGLMYAHQHGIVHSDLKPSNIFITTDNAAKIFDFGIARACKVTSTDTNDSDKTLFDPTELGALTPTYASLEMLEGQSPKPDDDLYSIACVYYEMLTGRHPYSRLAADEAKKHHLKPKKIDSINSTKAKVIYKALAFNSEQRYKTIEQFIKAFNKQRNNRLIMLFPIGLLLFSLAFFPQFINKYEQYQQRIFISTVNSIDFKYQNDPVKYIQDHLSTLEQSTLNYVLNKIKTSFLETIQYRINYLTNDSENRSHYTQAESLIQMAQTYYSDSVNVDKMSNLLEQRKFNKLNQLNNQFNELLEMVQLSRFDDISEHNELAMIIKNVKHIDSSHPLLSDERFFIIISESIKSFIQEKNYFKAQQLLSVSNDLYEDKTLLLNLSDQLNSARNKNADNYVENNYVSSKKSIMSLKADLSKLIEQSGNTKQWHTSIEINFKQLEQKTGKHSRWLNEKKQTLASIYLNFSAQMRDANRLAEARRFQNTAKQYDQSVYGINDAEEILIAHENIARVKYKAKQKLANIEGLKTTLFTQLRAKDLNAGLRTYHKLERILGRNDPYVTSKARQMVAQTYYQQAKQFFDKKKYENSLLVIDKGLKFERQHSALRNLQKKSAKQMKLVQDSQLIAQKSMQSNEQDI